MGKKPSKRRRQRLAITEPERALPQCPYCGTTNIEKSALSGLDGLFRSHAELCTALRSVGRQMLRFEKHDGQSLDNIRKVLKRATNIRRTLRIPEDVLDPPGQLDDLAPALPVAASECSPGEPSSDAPIRKDVQKDAQRKHRLTRPHSLRILKFPTA